MEKTTENLVDIGGVKLFAKVEGNSTPAVVIETGGGACSSEWILVQKELSKHTTVISYDRAMPKVLHLTKNAQASKLQLSLNRF